MWPTLCGAPARRRPQVAALLIATRVVVGLALGGDRLSFYGSSAATAGLAAGVPGTDPSRGGQGPDVLSEILTVRVCYDVLPMREAG